MNPPSPQNIQVAVRIRNVEPTNKSQIIAEPNSNSINVNDPTNRRESKQYNFDYVLGMDSTQEMVFQIVKPIIQKCLTGYNGCIFAYGQTGSGKTFAMEGLQGNQRGVIPRVAEQLMLYIENNSRRDNLEGIDFSVRCSYLEIYQESLRDLLLEKKYQGDLKIRMDPNSITGKELYVEGLTETSIKTSSDLLRLIQNGTKNRTTGETNMNKVSSRSHAVFTLIIEQTERKLVIADSIDNLPTVTKKRSKIHLIDLAGSERADSTGATGIRLKEGSAINVSLSCLGNVINALSTSNTYVPYRDSKLTYLLSDSLGGNSLTLVLACLTPLASVYEETIATLRFAERAKKVKNKPTINVDPATLRIMALEAEILRLTNLLSDCQCKKSKPPVMETRSTCTNSNKKQSQTKSKRPNWFQRLFCCCCYESEPETLKTQTSKPYSSLENLKNSKQVHPHSSVENLKTRKQVHPHSSIENLKQSQISAPKANAKVIETLNVSKPSNDIIKPSPSAKSAMKASESNNSKFTLNVNVEDSDSDSDSEIMNKRRGSNSKAFAF